MSAGMYKQTKAAKLLYIIISVKELSLKAVTFKHICTGGANIVTKIYHNCHETAKYNGNKNNRFLLNSLCKALKG